MARRLREAFVTLAQWGMMMAIWNASELSAKDRFAYWKDVLCEAYIALNPVIETDHHFGGSVRANPLGSVNVTTISSTRQKVYRRRQEISKMPAEVYFLNLQVEGSCRMMQGGREAYLQPGDFSIVDSTEPYLNDYCSDHWTQHSFRIPRAMLQPFLKQGERQTATLISGSDPVARVATEYLTSVAHQVQHLGAVADSISSHIVDLVSLAVGVSSRDEDRARGAFRQQLAKSLMQYIAAHAADPELTPARAAQHFRISVRYVHRLLEESGETFSRLLLRRRLDRCAQELRRGTTSSIGEIAFRWGFNDLSHFSRSFRNQFGVTPREYKLQS